MSSSAGRKAPLQITLRGKRSREEEAAGSSSGSGAATDSADERRAKNIRTDSSTSATTSAAPSSASSSASSSSSSSSAPSQRRRNRFERDSEYSASASSSSSSASASSASSRGGSGNASGAVVGAAIVVHGGEEGELRDDERQPEPGDVKRRGPARPASLVVVKKASASPSTPPHDSRSASKHSQHTPSPVRGSSKLSSQRKPSSVSSSDAKEKERERDEKSASSAPPAAASAGSGGASAAVSNSSSSSSSGSSSKASAVPAYDDTSNADSAVHRAELHGCRSVREYERMNTIDEGMYGVVHRAKDIATGEVVALKKIKMDKGYGVFPITSLREINILLVTASPLLCPLSFCLIASCLQSINHPNIVNLKEIVVGEQLDEYVARCLPL
jgi:hypothetical protein